MIYVDPFALGLWLAYDHLWPWEVGVYILSLCSTMHNMVLIFLYVYFLSVFDFALVSSSMQLVEVQHC